MDIGAYAQIESLDKLAKANGINVDRLRGYRLMSNETAVTDDELAKMKQSFAAYACERAIEARPRLSIHPHWFEGGLDSSMECKKYIIYNGYNPVSIRWDRIHGKRRKVIKYYVRHYIGDAAAQYKLWNSFVGRDDVLYIHAKLGNTNWSDIWWQDYKSEPWFLAGIDDAFDSCYCDIYAKISKGVNEDG